MGKMIVLEGLDGCGKTTQTALLLDRLRAEGRKIYPVSFPMYEKDSSSLVRLYLNGGISEDPDDVNAYASSMLFAADRYISYMQDWRKAKEDPETLIFATRYTTANAYHQLAKLPETEWDGFLQWLFDFECGKLGLPYPDQVFLLEMPYEVSAGLTARREQMGGSKQDIHEKDADYQKRCRKAAVYAADKLGWTRINCCENGVLLPRDTIAERIRNQMIL